MSLVPADPDIDYVLNNPELSAILHQHATKSHSAENLDFLKAVEELENLIENGGNAQEVQAKAAEINDRYLNSSSLTEVNLDEYLREPLVVALNQAGSMEPAALKAALKPSKDTIKGLVNYDTFHKMKNDSQAWKERMADLKALDNRVDDLMAKKEKLATSKWAQFKAVFQGGTQKVKEKLDAKIQTAKDGIMQMTDPNSLKEKRKAQNSLSSSSKSVSRQGAKVEGDQSHKQTNRESMNGKLGTGKGQASKVKI